ncbi:MAG TPA: AtpZ/AtpI family protein [Thermoanaerobaculia bacterium]|nr:AtpZ/AtpI family protein [Thermoanaerobaculia bacterium]
MKRRRGWAEAVSLGVMFPALLAAGYLLGKWVGRWLGLGESAAIAGAALGAVGAFIELFRWASRPVDE